MFSPNHRSYYIYFEKQHQRCLQKTSEKKIRAYKTVRKLLGKDCTVSEYNFLFNQIKSFLKSALNIPQEDKGDAYLTFLDNSRPKIFDNFHVDLAYLMPIEEELHPWKLKHRFNAQKRKLDVKSILNRIKTAYTRLPLDAVIGINNN